MYSSVKWEMTLSTYPKGLLLIIHENHLEQCLEHVIWSINVHYYYSHVYSKQRIICRLFFFRFTTILDGRCWLGLDLSLGSE